MASEARRLQHTEEAWDVNLDTDVNGNGGIGLMLAEDENGNQQIEELHGPLENTEQLNPSSTPWRWQPNGGGSGHSYQSAEGDRRGAIDWGKNIWQRTRGLITQAGYIHEVPLPDVLTTNYPTSRIFSSFEWGGSLGEHRDLWLSTLTPLMLRVPNGIDDPEAGANLAAAQLSPSTVMTTLSCVTHKDHAYVSAGGSAPIHEFDGSTFTAADPTVTRSRLTTARWQVTSAMAVEGAAAGRSEEFLVATTASGTFETHVTSDPKDPDNWSGDNTIRVGSNFAPVQELVSSARTTWFGTPEGLKGLNGDGTVVNLTPWFKALFHSSSGAVLDWWNNRIWIAHEMGVVMVNPNGIAQSDPSWVNFGHGVPNATPVFGRPRIIKAGGDVLYVAYFNGLESFLCTLEVVNDEPIWNVCEAYFANQEITFVKPAAPAGIPRVWIGTYDNVMGRPRLYWQEQPKSGCPLSDYEQGLPFNPNPTAEVRLPRIDLGDTSLKFGDRVSLNAKNVGLGGNRIAVDLAQDDGAFVEQGVMLSGKRWTSITAPEDAPRGVELQARLRITGNGLVPCALRSFKLNMSVVDELLVRLRMTFEIGEGQRTNEGHSPTEDDPRIKLRRALALQKKGRIRMRDPLDQRRVARVEQGARVQYVKSAKGKQWKALLTLVVAVFADSRPRYNQGYQYGGGDGYGGSS